MPKHITETTQLKCNQGAIPTPLSVTSQTFMKIEGKLQATEEDCKPNVNIKPFGTCLATNSACVPATQKWENTSEFDIDNKKELLDTSTCKCSAGNGTISVVKSAQTFSEEGGKTIYQPIVYDYNKKEDEDNLDEDFNDYQLLRNGVVKFSIDRGKETDKLFASDSSNKIDKTKSIIIKKENKKSILNELAAASIPDDATYGYLSGQDGEKMFPLGINRTRTNDSNNSAKLFLFLANNSDVEWGLAGYNINGTMTYALWTGHAEDRTPTSILYQGISKLSFHIHSHPGDTLTPSPINSANKGDYSSVSAVNNIFHKNRSYPYPRNFMYSKKGKHLWEYSFTSDVNKKEIDLHYYPGNPKVVKPMPINDTMNLKNLEK
jgi:hypothetical protein